MGIKLLLKWPGILAIVFAFLIPLTSGADIGIVFSEILYDSDDIGDTEGEWLEIYNSTSADVNVGGWKIQDNTDTFTIPSCTIIGAGGYLILAQDKSYFYSKYGFYPNIDNSTLRLHNDGDFVILKDKEGNIKDQAAWESGGSEVPGWSSYTLPYAYTGKSIVRYNLAQDTNTYVDWRNNQNPSPFSNTLPPGKPTISLNPTKLDFNIIKGSSAPAQTFAITNPGCGTLNWTIKESAGWLSCTPLSGTGPGTVTVTIDAGGLVLGTYNTTITVSDVNATNSPQTLAVKLIISNAVPIIEVNPTSFSFTAECDGPSQSNTFTIGNSGGGNLNWTVSDDVSWLSCSPASGSGSGVVTVLVDASGLNAGTYTAAISVIAPNAVNSPQKIPVTLAVTGLCKPEIVLNRRLFSFGAVGGTTTCIPQTFLIDNGGPGTLNWTVTGNATWLNFSPASGIGAGQVILSLNNSSKELPVGTYFGTVTVSDPNASNSPQIVLVSLAVHNSDAQPFGEFATPTDGVTVYSSIPVTGWVLDDVGVERVTIYRHDENAENGLAYVGDAVFVEGARPDVEDAYPQYPLNYKAGWGYMMLTNALPPNGNGSYVLEAIARDCSGTEITLGTKTIIVDNITAVKPFGAIDTPSQGGDASGQNYRNQGWALTPIPNKLPADGSTINVYVDGVNLGSVEYGIPRSDVKNLFPGYLNSEGPGGYFDFDTTKYANGVHTIAWVAADDVGNADGIGSRYFNILNLGLGGVGILHRKSDVGNIETDYRQAVEVKKGCRSDALLQKMYPDNSGVINIEIKELEMVDIIFGTPVFNISILPVGSSLDNEKGIFHWQPGPGFLGPYEFVFCTTEHRVLKKKIKITIVPIY